MATIGNGEYAARLEEVALELGISVARVQQIEQTALRKIRTACQKCGIGLEDFIDLIEIDQTTYRPNMWETAGRKG
jgi:DNA-directed RNA polymerase sigma subunit (sigma70/sigma32)